ncbi:hypothetical protein BV394_13405 [Brevirhabdus pacifica]|uniref:Membrane-anchored protein n=1 Tax=Brevirhabdus pacifica TaxID=1267768 RepID=A0A1U7DL48_9RHOB|nr:DUF3422 domain-containing protein [Brevirhabdus pacifica]APX90588.1 hypothetical protein BV394_13405 [Brevirhabdus pacifica]OWU78416.1 hypothetical protein ATO5_06060 [Loktanella sp. 22II-4b]
MSEFQDHPRRYALANELHARPFPALEAPCHAVVLAIKRPEEAARRDRDADRAHLLALLDRYGASHPQPGATHYFGELGRHRLKWESHTEFVTYTVFTDGIWDRPFDPASFEVFPDDWLAEAPGARITSAMIRVEELRDADEIGNDVAAWFVPESLAISSVVDNTAIIAADFRIDAAGHMRFAVFVRPGTGSRRIGRIVQRLSEIETYKTMSMLGFARAQELSPVLGELDSRLTALMGAMSADEDPAEAILRQLLDISAELENLTARSSFRFGATGAYQALVHQRIEVMREERYKGRQTFREFMTRRFEPAMRTVSSTERRLQAMADRAMRAGELLRTRVDVARSAQNQELMKSMDQRAALQLRLQKTVEGLSVVAISYYAVSLASYMLAPLAKGVGLDKLTLTALITPLIILAVWAMVHRIRKHME